MASKTRGEKVKPAEDFAPTSAENESPVVDFTGGAGAAVNLKQLIGKTVLIEDAKIVQTRNKGEMVRMIIRVRNEKGEYAEEVEAFTFSRVVADQVRNYIIPLIHQGKAVRAKVAQHPRGYLMLTRPE